MRYSLFFFFTLISFAQQTTKVDFTKCNAVVEPIFSEKSISGLLEYNFNVKSSIDTIRIDAKNMSFENVTINNIEVKYKASAKELLLFEGYKVGKNTLKFNYKATPKQALYFVQQGEIYQIWTQGQGKYTSYWLPSFDDVNEKIVFNMSVKYRADYDVVSNGKLTGTSINEKGSIKTWNFNMRRPMASYLVMLAVGNFNHKTDKSKLNVPLEMYFQPRDSSKFEPTYRYSTKIFNFLEKEIGVKYPWEIYRQIPVNDFLYAGMENTTSTIFAEEFVVDELGFNDRNYLNVNAHELAHQWFGDLITAKSGKHHWLQEGFATYYALLAEKDVFGEDYFYSKLYENWVQIKAESKQKDYVPILNEKASSLSFYQKGAWALHSIRTDIGEKKFRKAVKNYLKKYSFKNVETDEFLAEVKKVSNFDTENFKKTWLESTNCDTLANKYLNKWKQYKYLQQLYSNDYKNKRDSIYATILGNSAVHYSIKQKVLDQLIKRKFEDKEQLLNIAFEDKNINVQKGIVRAISEYPSYYQDKIDAMFKLSSYDIKMNVLNNIVMTEEQRKLKLLEVDELSKSDYDLRIIWLKIALRYPDFQPEKHQAFVDELNNYTSSNYGIYTRIAAFNAMNMLETKNWIGLGNLFLATKHHNWQLVSAAKEFIESYLTNEQKRNTVIEFQKTTSPEIQGIISKYLERYKVGG